MRARFQTKSVKLNSNFFFKTEGIDQNNCLTDSTQFLNCYKASNEDLDKDLKDEKKLSLELTWKVKGVNEQ